MPPSSNHAGIIPYVFPWILILAGFFLFAISKIFLKKWNWLITLITVLYTLYFSLNFYFKNSI
ncbi:MAG: hypothetical protein CMC02_11500 [Flavobacteriaceae bacterium]|nr:hypothetical protein [Flavobacteriaceae bacterium]